MHRRRHRCGESASAFHTTNPLTNTQQGLLATLHPRCLACSPRSSLPNEFMIIQFSREMKHGDREIKKSGSLLGTLTSGALIVTDVFYFNHKQKTLCTIRLPAALAGPQAWYSSKGCFGILDARLVAPGSRKKIQAANRSCIKVMGVWASLPSQPLEYKS